MRIDERGSYARFDHWRKYQRLLPDRIRLSEGREPTEGWWSWRGAEIHLDRFTAPAAPLTVVMLHGAGGCGRLLAPFGLMLQAHGYEVVLPDLPGYGLSLVPTELFAYDRWVDCATDLVEAETRRTGRPVALFGMSVGGYLAYLTAAQGRKAAGVIATTLADPRLPIVRDQFARHPRLNRAITPLLPLLANLVGDMRLPIKWFSNMKRIANNPEIARLLCDDPVGGGNRVPLRFMRSLLAIRPVIEPEDFDLCPLLLAHPGADSWTTIEASRPFFDRVKGPKELVMLENCGHLPIDEPGINRLEEAIVAFLRPLTQSTPPNESLQHTAPVPN
ncbi:MAG TPA: alpha/beta hydrolase [Pirellulales bacterium]|nr:alpha/beta hydrolase [Pirellulales bacterium]